MILLQKGFAMGKLDILNLFKYLILYFAAQEREFQREKERGIYVGKNKDGERIPFSSFQCSFFRFSSDSSRTRCLK